MTTSSVRKGLWPASRQQRRRPSSLPQRKPSAGQLSRRPEMYQTLNNLGLVYTDLRRYNSAREVLEKAIRVHSGFAEGYYNLGRVREEGDGAEDDDEGHISLGGDGDGGGSDDDDDDNGDRDFSNGSGSSGASGRSKGRRADLTASLLHKRGFRGLPSSSAVQSAIA